MKKGFLKTSVTAALATAGMLPSLGFGVTFEAAEGTIQGSFDTTVTAGFGRRMESQSCALVGDTNSSCGASAATSQWSAGDNGNLNYNKGDFFSTYLKGTHELLLKMPDGWKFMARGSWMKDFKADDTRRTDLSDAAKDQIVNDLRLLDLWVSKDFQIGGQNARARFGNQVINWGESLFGLGGINATNAIDLQRLMVPGTQIKEAILPAPMISLASGLGNGLNFEGYYQFAWNRSRVAPVGGYFSVADFYDKGREPVSFSGANFNATGADPASLLRKRSYTSAEALAAIGAAGDFGVPVAKDIEAKNSGQYGLSLHYKPIGSDVDFGFYMLNYHDKFPVLNLNDGGEYQWKFLENRKLYGISANFPVGNWAVGTELSYRPKDAISLSGCFNAGGALDANTNGALVSNCPLYKDKEKYQLHLTGMLQLTPGDHGPVLNLLGADSGYFSAEAVVTRYSGVSAGKRITRTIEGMAVDQVPAAGYLVFFDRSNPASPIAAGGGTSTSWGYVLDFNWTYDGKLISGWQVTPGMTFSHSVSGETPTYLANYLSGAKAANFYVLFNQNPAVWQAGINYTTYFGGKDDPARQIYKDRDFVGVFVSRTF
ncbi:MAG TPA: DUF1302 domain-containing protein [Burkholderiaceae bacterium]|nr:DUF1302 domain-containing protein [Burkholderiaceae bacterium]